MIVQFSVKIDWKTAHTLLSYLKCCTLCNILCY